MAPRTTGLLLHGRDEPSPELMEAHSGFLTALIDGPNLRHVRIGETELVQRVYVALRDLSWNVIPARISELDSDIRGDSFTVKFRAHHQHGDIDFSWRGTIAGTSQGSISYELDGQAGSSFTCNKLGLLVLHPIASHAGKRVRLISPNGQMEAEFPATVGPQAYRDGKLRGLFPPFSEATVYLKDGVNLRLSFEGDLFETEDERNWSEYSYKSYSGSLAGEWPVHILRGQSIKQTVRMDVVKAPPARYPTKLPLTRISLHAESKVAAIPAIGFGLTSELDRLSARETALLRPLRPDCLLLDLHLGQAGASQELASGARIAADLDSSLLIALYVGRDWDRELRSFIAMLPENGTPEVRGLLVFEASPAGAVRNGTPAELVKRAHDLLHPQIPDVLIGGGSERYFSEVNRGRPPFTDFDWIAFGVSPACHADEDEDVMENVRAQRDVVLTLRQIAPNIPLIAGPVTFQTRFGSWPRAPRTGDLPLQVDPRQASLFGSAWTLGSVAELTAAGVDMAVYFELAGWRGLIERDAGNPMPNRFASRPGDVLPLYHVFADLADLPRQAFLPGVPPGIACIGFSGAGSAIELLVANLTPNVRDVAIEPFPTQQAVIRTLDQGNAQFAMEDCLQFRASADIVPIANGRLSLNLQPYAYLRITGRDQSAR